MRQVSVMTKIYQLNLLVVVQSKHSVVVAGNKRQFQNELFQKWSWGEKDLTKDAGKGWPVWGVEGAIGLTCCQDKRGRKPVVVKNLLIQSTVAIENISIVLDLLLLDTCPSGQMNVKLKPTFGAGCKSKNIKYDTIVLAAKCLGQPYGPFIYCSCGKMPRTSLWPYYLLFTRQNAWDIPMTL